MRYLMIAGLASASFVTSATTAETRTVCASGCQYTSINAAIDAANPGDVIQLSPETYTEGSVINTDGKAITLRGVTDKAGTPISILDGADSHQVLLCNTGETSATVFENLLIKHGSAVKTGEGGGMSVDTCSPHLANCHFVENGAFEGGGLATNKSQMTVTNCHFENNGPSFIGGGVSLYQSTVIMKNCTFTGNQALLGGGVGLGADDDADLSIGNIFENCIFTENIAGDPDDEGAGSGGGMFSQLCTAVLIGCRFTENTCYGDGGAFKSYEAQTALFDCTICSNTSLPAGSDQIEGPYIDMGTSNCITASCDDCTEPVHGDLNGDGELDVADFIAMRELIGVDNLGCVAADFNNDGVVNGADLSHLLSAWGPCP